MKSWLKGAEFRLYILKMWFGEVASRLNLKGGPASVKSVINVAEIGVGTTIMTNGF